MAASATRIPTLDGLRAVSIVLVLVPHTNGTRGLGMIEALTVFDWGRFGVRVFFVISGFLITTLLLAEQARHGRVSLRDFYLRRAYRILPAFYAYLAFILALAGLGVIALRTGDAVHALTFTTDFHAPPARAWWLGHLWSISVEEQFYLLWPGVIAVAGVAGGRRVAVAAIALAPIVRVATFALAPGWRDYIDEAFPTIVDAIATGCVLACVRDRLWATRWYRRALTGPGVALALGVAIVAARVPRVSFELAVGQTLTNLGLAVTIDWCIRHPASRVGRMLEARPLVWLGTLSYSLYLWQQAFLNRHGALWINRFPLNVGLAFAAAVASFYLIERPFLALRARRRHLG